MWRTSSVAGNTRRPNAAEAAIHDLPEILTQDDLTVESLLYQLLLLETKATAARPSERRRISNQPRDPHPRGH